MSSFASLKAARAGRQIPLASRDRPSSRPSETPIVPDQPVSVTPMETDATGLGGSPSPDQVDEDGGTETETSALSTKTSMPGEPSIPVKGLPAYQDLPEDRLEIRTSKRSGRGMYVKSGAFVKKGKPTLPSLTSS